MEPEVDTLKLVLEYAIPIFFTIVGPLAPLLAIALYKKVAAWLNVKTSAAQEQQLREVVAEGTAFAEQMSAKWAKSRNRRAGGDEKLEMALEFVTNEARRRGLPELVRSALEAKIEAELGVTRRGIFIEATSLAPENGSSR